MPGWGLEKPLIWTTAQGEKIAITQMETSHLFNSMKMTFNHLAEAYGGEPVWFKHQYGDFQEAAIDDRERLARIVIAMLSELERRQDLPVKYAAPLAAIREQVFGRTELLSAPVTPRALCETTEF